MSTVILNPPSPDLPVLTSALYSLRVSTDRPKLTVEIVRSPAAAHDIIFSTTLYPFDGIVEFTDIGTLIEERFRALGLMSDDIEIRFDDVVATFTALHCEYELPADFDPALSFLCASGHTLVHTGSAVSLAHLPDEPATYRVRLVGFDAAGSLTSAERTFTRTPGADHLSFAVSDIIGFAAATPAGDNAPVEKAAYFTVSHGRRQKLFYIVDHPFYLTFRFRNIFNAVEYLDIVGTVSRKTIFDRESAICSDRFTQYNRTSERTYEVQTAPLTAAQAGEIEQLIGSRDISLCTSIEELTIHSRPTTAMTRSHPSNSHSASPGSVHVSPWMKWEDSCPVAHTYSHRNLQPNSPDTGTVRKPPSTAMKKAIHISQARAMLDRGERVSLRVVTVKGRLIEFSDIISLSFDRYKGTRSVKSVRSGEIRTIHDVCIIGIDDFDVYL